MRKAPVLFVAVDTTVTPAALRSSTRASGSTPPVGSTTTPVTGGPAGGWASAG